MTSLPSDPESVFHLTTPEGWVAAQATGTVVPPGFAEEGFVHCSTGAQLASTIERHFAGHDELVLLRLHLDRVTTDLRWEEGRPGEAQGGHCGSPQARGDQREEREDPAFPVVVGVHHEDDVLHAHDQDQGPDQ